jgi:hypothetical protein
MNPPSRSALVSELQHLRANAMLPNPCKTCGPSLAQRMLSSYVQYNANVIVDEMLSMYGDLATLKLQLNKQKGD